jgi:hypothetical protein
MSEQHSGQTNDAGNVASVTRPEIAANPQPAAGGGLGVPTWPTGLPIPSFVVPQGVHIPQGMMPFPAMPMISPEMARQVMASMVTAANAPGLAASAAPSPSEPHSSIRSSNVSPAPSGVSGAAGAESEAGGVQSVADRSQPPSKKRASTGGKTEKGFPKELFPLLAQTLKTTDSMSMDDIASKFVAIHPGPSVRCVCGGCSALILHGRLETHIWSCVFVSADGGQHQTNRHE